MCLSQDSRRVRRAKQASSLPPTHRWQWFHSNQDNRDKVLTPGSIKASFHINVHMFRKLPYDPIWCLQLLKSFSFTKISYKTTGLSIYKAVMPPEPQLWHWQNPPKLNSDYLHFLHYPLVLHGFTSYPFKKHFTDTVFSSEADGNIYVCSSETLLCSSSRELTLPNPPVHFPLWAVPPLKEIAKPTVRKYLY